MRKAEKVTKVCWASSALFFTHLGPVFLFIFYFFLCRSWFSFYERRSEGLKSRRLDLGFLPGKTYAGFMEGFGRINRAEGET